MFGHKRLGALVALWREEKAGSSTLKNGKEKLVRRDVRRKCFGMYGGEQENLKKSIFMMSFLAGRLVVGWFIF